ncbi:MAG: transglycosylase domain-containing protein [Candidatus Woesebacteria bacterium]|jgi:membrane peptidoglycan carboxypeptidase
MKKLFRKVVTFGIVIALLIAVGSYFGVTQYFKNQAAKLPLPPLKIGESSVILASNGEELGHIAASGAGSESISDADMPVLLRQAHLSAEDRSYYKHGAISAWGLTRAMITNAKNGAISAGGSTITQQYVKNAYLSQEQTAERKIREAQYAYQVESKFSKDEILDKYMNSNYYGRGSYGIADAAQMWFGVDAKTLTIDGQNDAEDVARAAFLAALIKSPSYYSTIENGKLVHEDEIVDRQKYVLDGLRKIKGIDESDLVPQDIIDQAKAMLPLAISTSSKPSGSSSDTDPFLLDHIKSWTTELQTQIAKDTYGLSDDEASNQGEATAESMLARGGLTITTSIDPKLQSAVGKAVKSKLPKTGLSAGVIIMNPETGSIVAMYGGTDYSSDGFNNALYANRQPGSTMKPLVLADLVDEGISVQSQFAAPASIAIDGPAIWNDDKKAANGCKLTLADAIAYSNNPIAIEMISGKMADCNTGQLVDIDDDYPVSPATVAELYRELGGDDSLVPGRTNKTEIAEAVRLAIGDTLTTTPFKMASAYSTLANGGVHTSRYIIEKITSSEGGTIYENNTKSKRIVSESTANTINQVMTGVFTKGTAKNAQVSGHQLAGKTGTTNSDAWMLAFNAKDSSGEVPTYVCSAWAGYKDNRNTDGDIWGSDVAKICQNFFATALSNYPNVSFSDAELNSGRVIGLSKMTMPSSSSSPIAPESTLPSSMPSATVSHTASPRPSRSATSPSVSTPE